MTKVGRPVKTKRERRDPGNMLRVSLNKAERAAIDRAAHLAFPDLSADRVSSRWARDILMQAAQAAVEKSAGRG